MEQVTVKWPKSFEYSANEGALEAKNDVAGGRYTLVVALHVIRRMETSLGRGAVFAEITRKNPLYRFVDRLYAMAGARVLQPFCLFLYMLKCVISIGPYGDETAEAVTIANFGNEKHTVDRLAALLPGTHFLHLSLDRSHMIGVGQGRAVLRLCGAAARVWPFLVRLARSHSFMPAARIASGLAYYIRFSQLFAERPSLRAALVASNYSPEALGLAAAAHQMGRRVVYMNHAPVPENGALVPPVLADCAVFYGEAIRQTYETRSRCTADVAFIGQPGTARPMEWQADVRSVGIFLTALTRAEAVEELVTKITTERPDVHILIRNHPVALLKSDFAELAARYSNLKVTIGNPLDDEITACDLIFCGNSGVAMNILRGGRPVAYLAALDELSFDYIGFVKNKLVCPVGGWDNWLYLKLRAFYTSPRWRSVMQGYDASYGADAAELEWAATKKIRRYLRPTPDRDLVEYRALPSELPSFPELTENAVYASRARA